MCLVAIGSRWFYSDWRIHGVDQDEEPFMLCGLNRWSKTASSRRSRNFSNQRKASGKTIILPDDAICRQTSPNTRITVIGGGGESVATQEVFGKTQAVSMCPGGGDDGVTLELLARA